MSFLSAIPIIGNIIDAVSGYQSNKQEIKKAKQQGEIKIQEAKIEAQIKLIQSDRESAGELDAIALRQVGWKDEFLMIITTAPLILAFVPDMVPYIDKGFEALDKMPEYYMYLVGGVYIYVLGFKRILLKVMESFVKKKLI